MRDLELLILQAKQGDVAAYGVIVRRFQNTAVGYAYGILGNYDAAKDAAQEAFLEAYAPLGELHEEPLQPGCAASFSNSVTASHVGVR